MAEDLVEKVISFFAGDNTGNLSDKEVILRQRLKELAENKYGRFFRHKTDEADPSLGVFFHTLYKMILPIRTFMKDVAKTTRLRQVVLEAFIDTNIIDIVKQLNPTGIEERFKTTSPEELTGQIRSDINKLKTEFDDNRRNRINRSYNLVMVFFQLAHFDYPGLLKKFDPNFAEGPFGGEPKFSPVKLPLLAKDLGDFLAVSQNINPDNDWRTLLKLLKICAGEEIISENQFAQMLTGLRDIVNSKILELMVQYGSQNPVWICRPRIPDEHIAEGWLDARVAKAQECINKINRTERNKQIAILLKEIFDHAEFERLENYSVAKSESFRKRELTHFVYAEGVNYLAVFVNDHFEKELHELCDILLIRGQWINNAFSKEMSEAVHQLMELSGEIADFDETLSDDGTDGPRLKAAMLRVDRDRSQIRYINSIIDSINGEAIELINNATQHFSVVDSYLKRLAEDIQKKHPEVIVNWRELNSVSKDPLSQIMATESKKLDSFIQLLQLCIQ
ncbi:MAG: DUF5312 family protein [Treponema sp.]|nr:DUF5312 family protein [Treponema sp.]